MEREFWRRLRLVRWLLCLIMGAAVLVLIVALLLHSGRRLRSAGLGAAGEEEANLTLNNFSYCDVEEGCTRWILKAAAARYFAEAQKTVLTQVKVIFFLRDGNRVELQGKEGVLYNDSRNLELSGNVHLSYAGTYQLQTDRLSYLRHGGLIQTSAPVSVTGRGLMLTGVGLRLKIANRTLTILEDIRSRLPGISFSGGRTSPGQETLS